MPAGAHGPGSGRSKSVRTTDNIAVVQDLICSQDDAAYTSVLCGALYHDSTVQLCNVCCKVFAINCRMPKIIRFGLGVPKIKAKMCAGPTFLYHAVYNIILLLINIGCTVLAHRQGYGAVENYRAVRYSYGSAVDLGDESLQLISNKIFRLLT